MNTVQRRLETMREELRRDIQADADLLARPIDDKGEDLSVSQHPADVASDLTAREDLVAEGASLARELRVIEAALRHLADGTYGTCVDCGRTIASGRLAARPQAERCIACQRRADR